MREKIYNTQAERQVAYRKRKEQKERKKRITIWIDEVLYEQIKGNPQKIIDDILNSKLNNQLQFKDDKYNQLQLEVNNLIKIRTDLIIENTMSESNCEWLREQVKNLEERLKILRKDITGYETNNNQTLLKGNDLNVNNNQTLLKPDKSKGKHDWVALYQEFKQMKSDNPNLSIRKFSEKKGINSGSLSRAFNEIKQNH